MGVLNGLVSTTFYPSSMPPAGAVDISNGNTRKPDFPAAYGGDIGGNTALPALWWAGILIVLIALRLIYEYT